MSKKKDFETIQQQLKNLETMSDQTAVHRKKFEYAISIFKQYVSLYISDVPSLVPRDTEENVNIVIMFMQDLMSIINQYVLQTWTNPTIENEPNFVLESLCTLFGKMKETSEQFGPQFAEKCEPDIESLLTYNKLDLKAISASFTQYLNTSTMVDSIRKKIADRLQTINAKLEAEEKDFAPRIFSPIPVHYSSWTVQYSDFEEQKEIGRGVSARVYKGIDKRTGEYVAIKKFSFQKLNSARFQSFQREVAVLATAQHPALLRLIGATDTQPFCIITEWMNGGSLYHAIHTPGHLGPTERTMCAFDIARGMQHLHSRKIVHRDLKSLNVLMDDNKKAKICDFGFSRFAENTTQMTSNIGTPHWMAPEVIKRGSVYTSKVDVYAYGIVLWELATSETPYSGLDPPQIAQQVMLNDLRPPLPTGLNPQMRDLMAQCWDKNPNVRPSFDEIVKLFKTTNLIFDGADKDAVSRMIKESATENEQLTTRLDKLFKAVKAGEETFEKAAQILKQTGLPHDSVEAAWDCVASDPQGAVRAGLLNYFRQTSKLGDAARLLRDLPRNSVDYDTMSYYVTEVPTGSETTDDDIIVAGCKNGLADLCSVYSSSPAHIALSLEVAAATGFDAQMREALVDRCVWALSSPDPRVPAAAIRCIIALGDLKRLPVTVMEKFAAGSEPSLAGLAGLALAGLSDQGVKISENALEMFLSKMDDRISSLVIATACKNSEESAQWVINYMKDNDIKIGEPELRTLLCISKHSKLREISMEMVKGAKNLDTPYKNFVSV